MPERFPVYLPDEEKPTIFDVKHFSCESKYKGSLFKALMALGPKGEEKCFASSNSEKKWSFKAFDEDMPHPDTIFLITKV